MKKKWNVCFAVFAVALMLVPLGVSTNSDADGTYVLTAVSKHGKIIDVTSGMPFVSGPIESGINLIFLPNSGHEFVEWNVNGECQKSVNGSSIAISELRENVTLTAVSRNYSTSQELITVVDSYGTPVPGDVLVNTWMFCSTELDRTGMQWEGMPCTPLIVNNVAYVRAAGILYALDISSGKIIKHISSGGLPDFYHYISYGNGVIFDTMGHKAYDLDLNYLYDIPAALKYASFHEGYFYGCLETKEYGYYTMYKTSTDIDKDLTNSVKDNLFTSTEKYRVFSQYGQFSNVIFEKGFFFFLQADNLLGRTGWRAMTAINLQTEVPTTIELTGFTGMPWDDGWLSYYNGYFYLTAYTAGRFGGVIPGLEDKRSSLMWVKFDFDAGTFVTPQYEQIKTPDGKTFRGIASGLEIHNGRGYLNVRSLGTDTLGGSDDTGTRMIAFNIGADGHPTPVGRASSVMTHGGIVVNTAHESEGKIYIYLIPYNAGSQGLYVFTDELIDGVWTFHDEYTYMNPNSSVTEYSSQAIRVGPNGEIIYYLDHGYVQCFVAANRLPMTVTTISNGYANVQKEYGRNAAVVLEKLYPGSTIDGGQITIGTKTYKIYGLNEVAWSYKELTDPTKDRYVGTEYFGITDAIYSQIAIVEIGGDPHFTTSGEKGWYFLGENGFEKCNIRQRSSLEKAVGCAMIYSETKPTSDSALFAPYNTVARESSFELNIPEGLESTFSVKDGTIVGVALEGSKLIITGLKEDTTLLTLTVGGRVYEMTIDVLPKVTHLNGDTIVESITSRPLPDGGKVDSVITTTSNKDGTTVVSIIKTYDSSGALTEIKTFNRTIRNSEISQFLDGQLAETDEYEEKVTDSSGKTISHVQNRKELISRGSQDGTLRTDAIEVNLDLLTNTLKKVVIVKISNFSYVSTQITSTVEKDDNVIEEKTEQTVESTNKSVIAEIKDGVVVIEVKAGDSADIKKIIGALNGSEGKPIKVNAGANIASDVLDAIADLGASLTMDAGTGKIFLDSDALSSLKGKGNMLFSVTATDVSKMTKVQKEAAGNAQVFAIDLKCGDSYQHDFGKFVVEIACNLEMQEGKALKVWRIDDYGNVSEAENVTYENGTLRFQTNHLSYYAVGYMPDSADENGKDNAFFFGICAAQLIIASIVALLVLRRK